MSWVVIVVGLVEMGLVLVGLFVLLVEAGDE